MLGNTRLVMLYIIQRSECDACIRVTGGGGTRHRRSPDCLLLPVGASGSDALPCILYKNGSTRPVSVSCVGAAGGMGEVLVIPASAWGRRGLREANRLVLDCDRQAEPDPAEMAERYGAEMTVPE
jgi:hypothetical protein